MTAERRAHSPITTNGRAIEAQVSIALPSSVVGSPQSISEIGGGKIPRSETIFHSANDHPPSIGLLDRSDVQAGEEIQPYSITLYDFEGSPYEGFVDEAQRIVYLEGDITETVEFSPASFPLVAYLLNHPGFHSSRSLSPLAPQGKWNKIVSEVDDKIGTFLGTKKRDGRVRDLRIRQQQPQVEKYAFYNSASEASSAYLLPEEQAIIFDENGDSRKLLLSQSAFSVAHHMLQTYGFHSRKSILTVRPDLTDRQVSGAIVEIARELKEKIEVRGAGKQREYRFPTEPRTEKEEQEEADFIDTNGAHHLATLHRATNKFSIRQREEHHEYSFSVIEFQIVDWLWSNPGIHSSAEIADHCDSDKVIVTNAIERIISKLGRHRWIFDSIGIGSGSEYRLRLAEAVEEDESITADLHANGRKRYSARLVASNRTLYLGDHLLPEDEDRSILLSRREYELVKHLMLHKGQTKNEIAEALDDFDNEKEVDYAIRVLRTVKGIDFIQSRRDGYFGRYSIDTHRLKIEKPFAQFPTVYGEFGELSVDSRIINKRKLEEKYEKHVTSGGSMPLTKEGEQKLGLLVRNAQAAWKYLENPSGAIETLFDGMPVGAYTHEELQEIVYIGLAARDIFIRSNRSLVSAIISRHCLKEIYLLGKDEVYQAGLTGLSRAVDKFDPRKGFKFSTYATGWIRNFVQQEAHKRRRIDSREAISLDAEVTSNSTTSRHDLTSDPRSTEGIDGMLNKITTHQIIEKLTSLFTSVGATDEEIHSFIEHRFWGRTYREIGEEMGYSSGTAENRVNAALEKLEEQYTKEEILRLVA